MKQVEAEELDGALDVHIQRQSLMRPRAVAFCLIPLYSDCIVSSHDGLTMPANLDRSSDESHDFIDLFENGALGLHFVGPDGIILNDNQAELDFLGYSRDEYIGHHIAEFHTDAAVIQDILARLSREGDTEELRGAASSKRRVHQACPHHVECPVEG